MQLRHAALVVFLNGGCVATFSGSAGQQPRSSHLRGADIGSVVRKILYHRAGKRRHEFISKPLALCAGYPESMRFAALVKIAGALWCRYCGTKAKARQLRHKFLTRLYSSMKQCLTIPKKCRVLLEKRNLAPLARFPPEWGNRWKPDFWFSPASTFPAFPPRSWGVARSSSPRLSKRATTWGPKWIETFPSRCLCG